MLRKLALLPCEEVGWALQPLSHRPEWAGHLTRFRMRVAAQPWSCDPVSRSGGGSHLAGWWKGGAARALSLFCGPGLCPLMVLVYSQRLACILSSKAW